nr:hypothetical protein [Carnobacterium maltaromaticum]
MYKDQKTQNISFKHCVSLMVGYAMNESEKGFSRHMRIPFTNNTKVLVDYCLLLFDKFYSNGRSVRYLGVSCSKLKEDSTLQLDLFKQVEVQINEQKLDIILDIVKSKYRY